MCSFLVQIIYGVCAVITLILTIVALALDAWTKVKDGAAQAGLFCTTTDIVQWGKTGGGLSASSTNIDWGNFKSPCPIDFGKFGAMDTGVKVIIACLILAIIMEVVCIAYNLFSAFACCCKAILLYVLLGFTLFVVLMLGIVVGVSASKAANPLGDLQGASNELGKIKGAEELAALGAGKSFIMIIVAFVASIIDAIVCGVAICMAKKLA